MSACKKPGCGMPIRFVQDERTGKRRPVDAAPDDDGNVVARRLTGVDIYVGHTLAPGEPAPAGWVRFMPHQATCRARGRRRKRTTSPAPQTLFDNLESETR